MKRQSKHKLCRPCGKNIYRDEKEALYYGYRYSHGVRKTAAYECLESNGWHVTTKYSKDIELPIKPENKNRYPKDWKDISRRVKAAAGWRCQCEGECGHDHDGRCTNTHWNPAEGTGKRVILTTAHLDHQPENNDESNLRAFCQGCHLRYDKDHHAETRRETMRRKKEQNSE